MRPRGKDELLNGASFERRNKCLNELAWKRYGIECLNELTARGAGWVVTSTCMMIVAAKASFLPRLWYWDQTNEWLSTTRITSVMKALFNPPHQWSDRRSVWYHSSAFLVYKWWTLYISNSKSLLLVWRAQNQFTTRGLCHAAKGLIVFFIHERMTLLLAVLTWSLVSFGVK